MDVAVGDEVEANIDPAGLCSDTIGVGADRLRVEGVDNSRLHSAARFPDLSGNFLKPVSRPACHLDIGPRRGERLGHGRADGAGSVDNRNLFIEHRFTSSSFDRSSALDHRGHRKMRTREIPRLPTDDCG